MKRVLAISTKCKIIMATLCNFNDPDKCTKLWVKLLLRLSVTVYVVMMMQQNYMMNAVRKWNSLKI